MADFSIVINPPPVFAITIQGAGSGASAWDDLTGAANHVPFDTTPTNVPTSDGVLYWDIDEGCLSYRVPGGSSELNK